MLKFCKKICKKEGYLEIIYNYINTKYENITTYLIKLVFQNLIRKEVLV